MTIYLGYKTLFNCRYLPLKSIPIRVQWTITISDVIACALFYACVFKYLLFLFRPYQLKGLKTKLILVGCVIFSLDALYRVVLQAAGKPFYGTSALYKVPLYTFFIVNISLQSYLVTVSFNFRGVKMASLICKTAIPQCFTFIVAFTIVIFIYPAYNQKDNEGKLLIALFAPLIAVVLKVISRISVQRLWNIAHPG